MNNKNWYYINQTKKAGANTMLIVGIGLIGFAFLMVVCGIFYQSDVEGTVPAMIIVLVIFGLPGALLIFLSIKAKKAINDNMKIVQYINAKTKISIEEICQKTEISQEKAIDYIVALIHKGIIDGHIDDQNNLILNEYEDIQKRANSNIPKIIVKCKSCGAQNEVPIGKTQECEYCGTILKGVTQAKV